MPDLRHVFEELEDHLRLTGKSERALKDELENLKARRRYIADGRNTWLSAVVASATLVSVLLTICLELMGASKALLFAAYILSGYLGCWTVILYALWDQIPQRKRLDTKIVRVQGYLSGGPKDGGLTLAGDGGGEITMTSTGALEEVRDG